MTARVNALALLRSDVGSERAITKIRDRTAPASTLVALRQLIGRLRVHDAVCELLVFENALRIRATVPLKFAPIDRSLRCFGAQLFFDDGLDVRTNLCGLGSATGKETNNEK